MNMKITWNDELYHYGMPRRSGRYKWGSGKNPFHHGADRKTRKTKRLEKSINKQQNELAMYKRKHEVQKKSSIQLTDDDKDFISRTANSKLLYKYRDQFSDKELRTALNRINTEKDLKSIRDKDILAGKRAINKRIASSLIPMSKGVESTVSTINRFKKGYDFVKKHKTK